MGIGKTYEKSLISGSVSSLTWSSSTESHKDLSVSKNPWDRWTLQALHSKILELPRWFFIGQDGRKGDATNFQSNNTILNQFQTSWGLLRTFLTFSDILRHSVFCITYMFFCTDLKTLALSDSQFVRTMEWSIICCWWWFSMGFVHLNEWFGTMHWNVRWFLEIWNDGH